MFEREFLSLMPDRIKFKHKLRYDDYGSEEYEPLWNSCRGRVRYGDEIIRRLDGEYVKSTSIIYVPPDAGIEIDDLVLLPDGDTVTVKMIRKPSDSDGVHHLEIICGE